MEDRTARIVQADHEVVWHPFTQQQQWLANTPLVIESGDGCWLTTTDGRRLLDGNSSLWVNVWGHDRAEIVDAIQRQAAQLPHATFLGLTNEPAVDVARMLIDLAPGELQRVFFSENGAAAVEVALKMAFAYHQHRGEPDRTLFVCLDNAYHGDTIGAVSVGGNDTFHELFGPLLFETRRIASPYCYRCPLGLEYPECDLACANELEQVLAAEGDRVAAVITEPLVQGASGIITAPDGHLRRLREICDRHGVLLIVDEIATGFGRTGAMFACDLEGVAPDLLCVGKGLTGGYLPMSATLATEQVHDAFLGGPTDGRTLYHGHSYAGNPLSAAAARANLLLAIDEDLAALSAGKSKVLSDALSAFDEVHHAGDVRQRGLMCGVELVADPTTKEPFDPALTVARRVCDALVSEDIILRPLGDVLVLMPAPSMEDDDLRYLVECTARTADRVTREIAGG